MKQRCDKCGQFFSENHQCASVDLKGDRHCSTCERLLSNEGWERWSKICRSCSKKEWREKERQERKQQKEKFGGKCNRCGYCKCFVALQFHHLDSSKKKDYGKKGSASLKELRDHPERFELLCANCHFEEHAEE